MLETLEQKSFQQITFEPVIDPKGVLVDDIDKETQDVFLYNITTKAQEKWGNLYGGFVWSQEYYESGIPLLGYFDGSYFSPNDASNIMNNHGDYLLKHVDRSIEQKVWGESDLSTGDIVDICALADANFRYYRGIRGSSLPAMNFRSIMSSKVCNQSSTKYRSKEGLLESEVVTIPYTGILGDPKYKTSNIHLTGPIEFQVQLAEVGGNPLFRSLALALQHYDPKLASEYVRKARSYIHLLVPNKVL